MIHKTEMVYYSTLGIKKVAGEENRQHQKIQNQKIPPTNADAAKQNKATRHGRWTHGLHSPNGRRCYCDKLAFEMTIKGQSVGDILGKDVDHTPAQSLVTHTTNPLLGHGDMASSGSAASNALT